MVDVSKGAVLDPKKQERENTFWLPDDGIFHLVMVSMQFKFVGEQKLPINNLRLYILGVERGVTKSAAQMADHIGGKFPVEMWWTFEKQENLNRLSTLNNAVGGDKKNFDEWDKGGLVKRFTAIPFKAKVIGSMRGNRREMKFAWVDPLEKKVIDAYRKDPDWMSIVGEEADRFLDDRTFTSKGNGGGRGGRGRGGGGGSGGGGGGGGGQDPFADPFDDDFASSGF